MALSTLTGSSISGLCKDTAARTKYRIAHLSASPAIESSRRYRTPARGSGSEMRLCVFRKEIIARRSPQKQACTQWPRANYIANYCNTHVPEAAEMMVCSQLNLPISP
ncbi:hypothetical protein KC325_g176 [Hortaea werneckii]|nr:hypothetical protein KC325_g176 [Hortaea werneckii]